MYGYICSACGAHLDPGEKCDCQTEKRRIEADREKKEVKVQFTVGKNGQIQFAV